MSNVHGIMLPAKSFRRAAKTGILTVTTFIRAMCAAQVKGQYLKLRYKEEAERVTVQLPARVCQSHTVETVVESCTSADTHTHTCTHTHTQLSCLIQGARCGSWPQSTYHSCPVITRDWYIHLTVTTLNFTPCSDLCQMCAPNVRK